MAQTPHSSYWASTNRHGKRLRIPLFFLGNCVLCLKGSCCFFLFFGWALASVNMIHINRGDREASRAIVASQGRKHLSEGKWIAIFPEGTRTPVGSFKPYRRGGVRLAVSTQTNILPVAQNSGRLWGKNSILKRPGLITVSILPVISVEGKSEDELQQALETSIETEMQRLG